MLFNSAQFLAFFPIVALVYFIIPRKVRYIWLLCSSYYFYMCWNAEYALLILTSTVITYFASLAIEHVKSFIGEEKEKTTMKKIILVVAIVINIAILFYFKYTKFAAAVIQLLLYKVGILINIPEFDIILPVGISFYTFQALGYVIDVYRDDIYAEKNFFRYALFVSFFPQLVAGPIERSRNLLKQLAVPQKFNYEKAREGLYLVLWGYFLKIVLADRIAIFVDTIYGDYINYPGFYLVWATVLFAVQIYCDFAGYSTIARGTAKILGIELMENFNAPYLSKSVAEFWRKWHISLTSWFKDYLYIPLGGSRKGKFRKQINKMIVFLVSGLWHGASFSFVAWGALNGLYQVIGDMLMPIRNLLVKILHLNRDSLGHKIASAIITFVMVDFAWTFFRAQTMREAIEIVKSMFTTYNPWIMFDGSIYNCGLNAKNYWIMIVGIGILFIADMLKQRGIIIRKLIMEQDYWFRWLIIDATIIIIFVFGIWGSAYDAASFIYFQF